MIMYSVFDTKVGTFMPPFTVQHPVLAIRAFVELASDAATMVAKNPADFCLMEIAHFDPDTGSVTPVPAPINKGTASSFLGRNAADAG